MRTTEYLHFITRTDIGIAHNPKETDYSHFRPSMMNKRDRYLYQCKLKGKEPVKWNYNIIDAVNVKNNVIIKGLVK